MGVPSIVTINVINGTTIDVIASEAMLQDPAFFTPANWVVSGGAAARSVTGVSGPSANIARLTISPEQLTGETLTVTPDPVNIVSLSTNDPFNPASGDWSAVGTPPQVSAAVALTSTSVRVTFNEAMASNAALSDVSNYSILPDLGGVSATVIAVIPEAVANPTYVDLILAAEMTDGVDYTVTVDTAVADAVGNTLNSLNTQAEFVGVGVQPTLSSVELFETGRRVRFNFSEPMLRSAALSSTGSYGFTVITVGASPIFVESVVVPDTPTHPEYVDVIVSEMTNGASYEAVVSTSGPTDRSLNTVNPAGASVAFVGQGHNPTILRVEAISQNRVDIIFIEAMKSNADIRDASRYTWDNGLVTLDVLDVVGDTVKLVTSDQTSGILYNLTIDPT
jgi:hypothetical protein